MTANRVRGAASIQQIFHKLDDADPHEIVRLIGNARAVLHGGGSNFGRLGEMIARAGHEIFRSPAELEPTAPLNRTICKLLLRRYRRALGLSEMAILGLLIGKLESGQPITNGDAANFRNVQANTRLVVHGTASGRKRAA